MIHPTLVCLLIATLLMPVSHAVSPGTGTALDDWTPAAPTAAEKQAIAEAKARAERERLAREASEAKIKELERKLATVEAKRKAAEATSKDTLHKSEPNATAAPERAPLAQEAATPLAHHPQTRQPLNAKDVITEAYGPRMVVIAPPPGGRFLMGSPANEASRYDNEKQHSVRLSYPFAMAETETTFAQWDACIADGGCNQDGDKDKVTANFGRGQQPVINVTHSQARQYADWLNQKLGLSAPYHYRLPSESEWEYAARAGNSGPFGFANNANISPTLALYNWDYSYAGSPTKAREIGTQPVGSYPPSSFGLKDMHGNVWEWVADCYEPDYSKVPDNGAAHRADDKACSKPKRFLRGGSWISDPRFVRTAYRFIDPAGLDMNNLGFRLTRMLPSGS